jgi:hypothetical protein
MKISKLLPVLCVLALGAHGLTARAEDNPAQAAARMALAKQLFALDAQQPPATNSSLAKPAVGPGKNKDDNVVMAPINQPVSQTDKAKAKAEKAAAKAKAKQDAQAAADLKAKQEADKKLAAQPPVATTTQTDADKQLAAQKAALAAALANRQASDTKPVPPPTAVVTAPPAPTPAPAADANYAGKDIGMKPMEAPALPITASKEAQLEALLAKYKADQITPEEYHKQREAILAQP